MTEADKIRAEIEAANEKMKSHMNFVSSFVAPKTVGSKYISVEATIPTRPMGFTPDGKPNYVIHKIS